MPQPPPPGFPTRAFTPIQNPFYSYPKDDSFKTGHPAPLNVLERTAPVPGVDRRRTSAGTRPPVAGLTPIVPMAAQTPYNVWSLYPA